MRLLIKGNWFTFRSGKLLRQSTLKSRYMIFSCTIKVVFALLPFLGNNAGSGSINWEFSKGKRNTKSIRDFSNLEEYPINEIVAPKTLEELQKIIKEASTKISVKGGGFSQGGQIVAENGIVIDMKNLNSIGNIEGNYITVGAGASWFRVQKELDKHGKSVKVMQSYNDFSVGGSLSVNVHGRYVGYGPIIPTIRKIQILTADGEVRKASRTENKELFSAAIGGYGLVGIIVEAELEITDDVKLERVHQRLSKEENEDVENLIERYLQYFRGSIKPNKGSIMTNANLYPLDFRIMDIVTFVRTKKPLTNTKRMQDRKTASSIFLKWAVSYLELFSIFKNHRANTMAINEYKKPMVVWRNFEASYGVVELQSLTRILSTKYLPFSQRTALLQEYFIPTDKLPSFVNHMCIIFKKWMVNVVNVSLRYVPQNNESLLSWSKEESFAIVIYYVQNYSHDKQMKLDQAKQWTQEMIDKILEYNGSYYLPYRIYAEPEQFFRAYSKACEFWKVKNKYDLDNKFSNYLSMAYFNPKAVGRFCGES